ncbi:hypothetical protein Hanom_Chr08g00689691 [Helianthus anomalus]
MSGNERPTMKKVVEQLQKALDEQLVSIYKCQPFLLLFSHLGFFNNKLKIITIIFSLILLFCCLS